MHLSSLQSGNMWRKFLFKTYAVLDKAVFSFAFIQFSSLERFEFLSGDVNITVCSYNRKYSHVWMKQNLNSPHMVFMPAVCKLRCSTAVSLDLSEHSIAWKYYMNCGVDFSIQSTCSIILQRIFSS